MTIKRHMTYTVECDICGEDAGDSKATYDEAREWAGDWEIPGTIGTLGGIRHSCSECNRGLGTI